MNADDDQTGSPPHVVEMIEAADRMFHTYLLRQHLSLWHPMSTAPSNHDLELIVRDGASAIVLAFPCRRTNTGEWINTELQTAIEIPGVRGRKQNRLSHNTATKSVSPTPDKARSGGAIHE